MGEQAWAASPMSSTRPAGETTSRIGPKWSRAAPVKPSSAVAAHAGKSRKVARTGASRPSGGPSRTPPALLGSKPYTTTPPPERMRPRQRPGARAPRQRRRAR